jgi:hypothetical protein
MERDKGKAGQYFDPLTIEEINNGTEEFEMDGIHGESFH